MKKKRLKPLREDNIRLQKTLTSLNMRECRVELAEYSMLTGVAIYDAVAPRLD